MAEQALHFGAGNIGRGFIGLLLSKAGYQVVFADVNEQLVDELKKRQSYEVVLADEAEEVIPVSGVTALHSAKEEAALIDTIASTNIVTTAVGPNVLAIIARSLAAGIKKRVGNEHMLLVIACENMIGGSAFLKEKVYEQLDDETKQYADKYVVFPNAAVDRIVPNQTNDDPLTVKVEPFYEWKVERPKQVADLPEIDGLTFVDDLTPYIERKLFTVNTGHAVTAYFGFMRKIDSIESAIHNEQILFAVRSALEETGALLERKFQFSHTEHQAYIEEIIKRFKNPNISDYVTRVGRSPIRKIGGDDRFVKPANQYVEAFHETPKALIDAIAAALHFDNPEDEEAVALQKMIQEEGVDKAITKYTGIEPYSRLFVNVKEAYEQLA